MKFRSKYSERKEIFLETGTPVKKEYAIRIVDGEETLAETGESDWYGYIQSHADSVDIHKILERCRMMDDFSPLMRMPAEFMDVTYMPKSLAEAYAMTKDAENFFERMPTSVKEKYDNNFVQFIQDIGSERFNSNVYEFLDSIKPVVENKEEDKE